MSITDELRKYIGIFYLFRFKDVRDKLDAIADRIDAEHEAACAEAYGNGVQSVALPDMTAYVKLPVDADGKPWHVGDMTENKQTVQGMCLNKHGWHFLGTVNDIDPSIHTHYVADTWERIVQDAIDGLCDEDELVARCKALAGEK